MTWADLVIVAICVLSAGFGFWRGFAKEAMALVTWLAAIWIAWRFAWLLEPALGDWLAAPEVKIWVARLIVFLVVLIAGGIVAYLVREVIRHTGLTSVDRTLGGLFGFFRGALIVGLIVIVMELAGVDQDPWWQRSRLKPISESIAAGIRHYAELGGRLLAEQELAESI